MKIETIENFLYKEDLKTISSLDLEMPEKDKIRVYHNKITKNNEIYSECLSKDSILRFQKNYHDRAIKLLNDLNPNKLLLYDYSEFHIIITGMGAKFPIHDDTPDKLLSGVIYIKPELSTGTSFYETKKGVGKKTVEWKVNRGVFFSRSEGKSWHSYEGDGKSNRVALVYNLMTNRIKDVYKIEKKNYHLGKFRYWINPYLYKFLKLTI